MAHPARRWAMAMAAVGLCALVCAGAVPAAGASTAPLAPTQTSTVAGTQQPAGTTTGGSGTATGTTTTAVPAHDTAYWMDATNGAVYSFGGAPNYGSMAGHHLNEPIVGMAAMPTGKGYWEVASDGGIFTFGAAQFYGSMGGHHLNEPIVGMAAAPTGHGYWLVASDGGIFTFGTAQFYGSMGGHHLNEPIVGMAPTTTGHGYWEVASDGGIFTFGTAQFYGSTGSMTLNAPVTGMAPLPTGKGYWLVATDGGMFTFGGAQNRFYGSLAGKYTNERVVGVSSLYSGKGYWLATTQGAVANFGTAVYWGSAPQHVTAPIVGIATGLGNGDPGSPSFQQGSYGYDVSNYQCTGFPPAPHQIGVVEVAGIAYGVVNPCLAQEVTWSAGGLNLYTFLSYGKSTTTEPGCAHNPTAPTPDACNFGYGAALKAFDQAKTVIGTRASVPWWLDVEKYNWSATLASNRSVVVGAYDALRYAADINTVGFYFSLANWNNIVGTYNPAAPLFPAWWTGPTPGYKCTNARTTARSMHDTLPTGPIEMVQYSDNVSGFDGDYAC